MNLPLPPAYRAELAEARPFWLSWWSDNRFDASVVLGFCSGAALALNLRSQMLPGIPVILIDPDPNDGKSLRSEWRRRFQDLERLSIDRLETSDFPTDLPTRKQIEWMSSEYERLAATVIYGFGGTDDYVAPIIDSFNRYLRYLLESATSPIALEDAEGIWVSSDWNVWKGRQDRQLRAPHRNVLESKDFLEHLSSFLA